MTAALEGGEWSAARPGHTLAPGKTQYPFYRRLGGPQGRSGQVENFIPTGIRSQTVQPIVSHCTDRATWPTNVRCRKPKTQHHYTILNSVCQHYHFITQGNYKATCFDYRLLILRRILSIVSQDAMHTLGSHSILWHN